MISMEEVYRQQQAGKVAADTCGELNCQETQSAACVNAFCCQSSLTEQLDKQARHQSAQSNQLFIALHFLKAHPEFEEFIKVQRILRDNGY